MKENKGHIRCIASGLKYILKKEFDFVIPMDGDGEDRPEEIKIFVSSQKNLVKKQLLGKELRIRRFNFSDMLSFS